MNKLLLLLLLTFSLKGFAQTAQNDPGASLDQEYDPFSDFSEYDENSDEEADVNFFRNGRFLTMGFQLGAKGFTDQLATAYTPNGTYGFFLAYFFDMRFALQLGYNTGDAGFLFQDNAGNKSTGNVSFSLLQIDGKYFLNPQNLTKTFGDLNPYLLGGLSNATRTYTLLNPAAGGSVTGMASVWGLDLGAGLEIPIMKKKAYAGMQFNFHYVNFPDANSPFPMINISQQTFSVNNQSGYQYEILGVLGVNF
jgi:hypothetical protein